FWVRRGSCQENRAEEGLAHFIEHAVFKGTDKYPTPEIISEISDYLGGHIDAFTGKESACFYGKVLRERLPDLVDLLCDLVTSPKFEPDELVRERNVILEEINQSEDQPDDWVSELFYQNFWEGGSLSHSILGRPEQVRHYTANNVKDFFYKTYKPKNLLIVAAGDIDSDNFISLVEPILEGHLKNDCPEESEIKPNLCRPFIQNIRRRSLNQTSLVMGFPAPCHRHADRVAANLLCNILGGGMSSRLFLELREKHALCYQIGSYTSHYCDSGALQIAASCAASKARELVQRAMAECWRLAAYGSTQAELDRAKLQLRTSLVFSQESSGSRMFSIAHQAMHMDSILDIDQQLAEIDNITLEQVCRVAREILVPELVGISALGIKRGSEIRFHDYK
ncbi:MAG: insulinase family protein, partial [Holophagales bacterium]|nr:insulinase family protein [Holophagales bacterium]